MNGRFAATLLLTVLTVLVAGSCRHQEETAMVKSISVGDLNREAAEHPDALVIDVRSHAEYEHVHAAPVKQVIVHTEMATSLDRLPADKDTPIYLICRTDNRSARAARVLADSGFTNVFVVVGGTTAWVEQGLPSESGKGVLDNGSR